MKRNDDMTDKQKGWEKDTDKRREKDKFKIVYAANMRFCVKLLTDIKVISSINIIFLCYFSNSAIELEGSKFYTRSDISNNIQEKDPRNQSFEHYFGSA